MTQIPKGWTLSTIPQIAEVLDTKRIPINSDERATRIDGKPQNSLVAYYGATGQVGWIDTHLFNEDLVLLGEDGVPFLEPGKPKAYRVSGKSWVNNHAHVLRARQDALDWRLLEAQLNTLNYTGHVTGSTRLKLTQGAMNKLPILVPPLAEQKRIADKLDTVLTRVDAVNTRLSRVAPLLKRFRQSVLAAATSGQLTEDWRMSSSQAEWRNVKISEICGSVADGDHQAPPQATSGIPFITIAAINDGYLNLGKASRFVPDSYYRDLADKRRPQRGDVLYSVTGSVGIPALVDTDAEFTFQRHIAILRPDQSQISSAFLFHLLGSGQVRSQALEVATGTAQLTIPLSGLRAIQINLPPKGEQTEIVRRVETLFAFADRLEARLAQAQTAATRLTPALLAKAFRGELVPQDPNDEPAAELLRRLQATISKEGPRRGRRASTLSA
jgi:type I restriction enzyme S subunit